MLLMATLVLLNLVKGQVSNLCRHDLPTLGLIGQGLLELSNWEKVKMHDLVVIGVSDSQCSTCCQSEGIL
jgi:hypothetical protein